MAPEMSTQTADSDYARAAAAASQPSSPTRAPAATHQPAEQQGTFAPVNTNTNTNTQQQQQQQGQFQAAYFQQDPRAYGQPFQPYTAPGTQVMTQQQYQQQFQQQQISPNGANNAVTAWVNAKVGMRIFSIIICICAVAISFSLPGSGGYAFVLCTPLFFVAMVWDMAEIVTWLLRKRHAGIHPGAHVGVSLILWMAAATVGGIQCTYVAFVIYDSEDYSSSSCWNSELQQYITCSDSDSSDPYSPVRARFLTVAVFACLVWLVHFTLFVSACIDTAKRNAAMRRVMVVAPPYWGQAYQGWQPMAQQPMGQQQQQQPQPHMASGALNMTTVQPPQSIPLQNRSPAPEDNGGSSKQAARGESSTQPAGQDSIMEYYTPSSR